MSVEPTITVIRKAIENSEPARQAFKEWFGKELRESSAEEFRKFLLRSLSPTFTEVLEFGALSVTAASRPEFLKHLQAIDDPRRKPVIEPGPTFYSSRNSDSAMSSR